MSCEENRLRYFERVAAPGGVLAGALGGESEARAVLEQIFNTARSDGANVRSPLQQHKAAGRTLQLFEEMEQRHGLSRPTHSTRGLRLPRADAQFGYQAVYDTIEAARSGRSLPDVAVRVLQQRRMRRTISSLRMDDHGYYRCSNCGQFASRTRQHICPFTASSAELARALHRRLGVPSGAYLYTGSPPGSASGSAGRRLDGLQELIDAARASSAPSAPAGKTGVAPCTLSMVHCLTGEEADVTLDGAIPALGQGFVPHIWVGRQALRHVELADRRVVAVLDAGGLNALDPASVLGLPAAYVSTRGTMGRPAKTAVAGSMSAVETAAAAYGTLLSPGTLVHSLGASRPALARSGFGSPPGRPVLLRLTTLQGGVSYDWGRFTGTEYRKNGSHGTPVEACGRTYIVGDRHSDPNDWSHARRTGAEPAPKGGVAVGRTLVKAVDLLSKGQVVRTEHGTQLYNSDGSELLAVYDPATQTAGDTGGTPSASPEQMAVLIAYWEQLGRSGSHGAFTARPTALSTARPATLNLLVSDLDALRRGSGSPLAVADSAYLVIRDHLVGGSTLTLGATVSTPRCPNCGRWMGDVHNCPAHARHPQPTEAEAQVAVPVPATPITPVGLNTPVAPVAPDIPIVPVAPATPAVTTPHSSLPTGAGSAASETSEPSLPLATGTSLVPDPGGQGAAAFAHLLTDAFDKLGDRLGDRLGNALGTVLGETLGDRLGEGRPENSSTDPAPLDPSRVYASQLQADDRMASALDRLATVLQEWSHKVPIEPGTLAKDPEGTPGSTRAVHRALSSKPEARRSAISPLATEARPASRAPVRPSLDTLPLTPQEHILKHVKPPEEPDPYLSRLDRSLGGQRIEPLPLHYEEIDPAYDVGASAEKALRIVSSSLQIAWDPNRPKALHGTHMRVFGFAGTAGTGKNATARQIAASLGLPYYETTLHRDTSLQEEIGQTVLQDGSSMPRLGPLGQAAAAGGVICINELVKANPGTLGALQRMMEDGVFEVQGTEAGMAAKEIPVHPSTVFICTWNPGYDGSSDRPDAALLSRIPTIRMDAPDVKDETRRLVGSLGALFGEDDAEVDSTQSNNKKDSKAEHQKQERLQEIIGRDYSVKHASPSHERVEIAVRFVRDLRNLAQSRQIGASSRHLLEPTPREALHFAAMCEATGDPLLALEQFKIYCDSGEGYDEQFKLVQQIFKRYYGEDGQALNRRAGGQGPRAS